MTEYATIAGRLKRFAANPPERYVLAQREAVNSRRERVLRGRYFREFVIEGDDAVLVHGIRAERLVQGVVGGDDHNTPTIAAPD